VNHGTIRYMQPATIAFLLLVTLFELAAIYLVWGFCRKPGISIARKLLWSSLFLIPFVGLIFYSASNAPSVQRDGERASETPYI